MLDPSECGFRDVATSSMVWKTFRHWLRGLIGLDGSLVLVMVPVLPAAPSPFGIQKPIWQGAEGRPLGSVAGPVAKFH